MHIILLTLILMFATTPAIAADDETVKINEVVVTATRYEEKITDVPANVSIISESEIQNSTAQNIPDLLRNSAGILVNDIGGNQRNMTVDIRGFGETATLNTLVLVDGRRVNEPDLSGTDWTQIPLDRVRKIEIIRGGRGSVLYGDNASGGVINIITKEGGANKAGAGIAAGSYDTYKGNAYVSGSSKDLSYSVNASYLSSDGYRTNSDTEAKDVGFNLNYYPGDIVKLNLSSGYHKDDTGLPGALKESDFDNGADRTDTVTPKDFAKYEDYYFKGGPEIYFWGGSIAKLDASFRRRNAGTFASFTGGNFQADSTIDTVSFSPQALLKNKIGEINNTLTIGLDYEDAKEDIENNSLFFGNRSIATYELKQENTGYYVHDEIGVTENVLVSGGYRHDRAGFTFDSNKTIKGADQTTIDEDLYTAGVNYSFYNKSYAYASFSKSYRYPVLDEIFSFFTNTINTNLKPQTSDDFELGLRHYISDNTYAHINVFRIDTKKELFLNLKTYANENMDGKTRRDGVEFSFSSKPLEWLTMDGSYTYMNAIRKSGKFKGRDIPDVPNHKATLTAALTPIKGFTFVLNGTYIGTRPFVSDFHNRYDRQPDYLVINSKFKYTWKTLTAFLDINNVTDKKYSEYGVLTKFPDQKAFYPSPERNFLFGISVEI